MKLVKQGYARILFAFFGALVVLDVALLFYSETYREAYGRTLSAPDVIWRIIPDVVMILFYWLAYWRMKNGAILHRVFVWHGVLYSLLGTVMCIPWSGYFLAPFTPVELLYMGSILWAPAGYFLSLVVAMAFVVSNLYLIRFTLQRKMGSE